MPSGPLRAGLSSNVMLTNEDMDAIFQCSDDEDGSGSHTGGPRLCLMGILWLLPFQVIWRGSARASQTVMCLLVLCLRPVLPSCTAEREVTCG